MNKKLNAICCVCKKRIDLSVETEAYKDFKKFPISVLIKHEDHNVILYLDCNFSVRGVEPIDKSLIDPISKNEFNFELDSQKKKGKIKFEGNRKVFFLD